MKGSLLKIVGAGVVDRSCGARTIGRRTMPSRPRRRTSGARGHGHDGGMDDSVKDYLEAIAARTRPLFDRIHDLILEVHPDAEIRITYDMPTYVGDRRLYLAAWKSWVSLYGWNDGEDGGFVARHPELTSGRGTIKIRPKDAEGIDDDELRRLIRGALG
jgi:uncharacterized protein YdhG (YjbR/CyaY superfamily)